MPSETVKHLVEQVEELQIKLSAMSTDIMWMKRIIVGAAGLGFLEKLIGWWLK